MSKPKLGATKDFPRGKLNQHDEGGLMLAIGVKDKTVMIDFGTPTMWIGLDKHTAIQFANSILEKAATL
jgi:hypothetical protein